MVPAEKDYGLVSQDLVLIFDNLFSKLRRCAEVGVGRGCRPRAFMLGGSIPYISIEVYNDLVFRYLDSMWNIWLSRFPVGC